MRSLDLFQRETDRARFRGLHNARPAPRRDRPSNLHDVDVAQLHADVVAERLRARPPIDDLGCGSGGARFAHGYIATICSQSRQLPIVAI